MAAPTLVIVDDMPDTLETLAACLRLDGYHVLCTASPLRALELAAEHEPIGVFLDIDMPELDGIELATSLRRQHGSAIVLIAISGMLARDDVLSRRYESLDHCLIKPIDPAALRRLLPPVDFALDRS